jgi:hypothetical protein
MKVTVPSIDRSFSICEMEKYDGEATSEQHA